MSGHRPCAGLRTLLPFAVPAVAKRVIAPARSGSGVGAQQAFVRPKVKRVVLATCAVCLALLGAGPAVARAQTSSVAAVGMIGRHYDLDQCLRLAAANYPKVRAALARHRSKLAQVDAAASLPFGQFRVRSGLGLAPTVRGTSVYSSSTDVALSGNMGLGWEFGLDGVVPLWTFGKLDSAVEAAKASAHAGGSEVDKERNDLRLEVRRAYYGLQLARDSLILVGEATQRIDDYLTKLERSVAEGDGDDIELVKMRMYRADLDVKASEAREQSASARAALAFLVGLTGPFDIPDRPLVSLNHVVGPVSRYLTAARLNRPEINMVRAGVMAKSALVRLQRARLYPDVGIGIAAAWRRAPEVDDSTNPYVNDSGNYLRYSAGLVLEWKLDLIPKMAQVAQAQAELEEMRATEQFALGGVGLEVEQAWGEAVETARRLASCADSARFARQWMVKIQQGIEVGTYEDADIGEPAKEYALRRFAEMKATFEHNVSLAKLARATGWEGMLAETPSQ
jgi:outer membrane protein TolC